jgi:DNA repair exonuclease SbcCD ATPase subunit
METNELLSSIANLEANLKEIDSARKQVNKTIQAYENVYRQIDDYAKSLDKVSECILAMVEVVKLNRQNLSADLNNELDSKFVEMGKEIARFKATTDSLTDKFAKQCDTTTIEIQKMLSNTKDNFSGDCTSIQMNFSGTVDKSLVSFKSSVEAEIFKMENCIKQLNNTLSSISKLHSEIEEKIIAYYKPLKQELELIKGQNETLLKVAAVSKRNSFVSIVAVVIVIILNIYISFFK